MSQLELYISKCYTCAFASGCPCGAIIYLDLRKRLRRKIFGRVGAQLLWLALPPLKISGQVIPARCYACEPRKYILIPRITLALVPINKHFTRHIISRSPQSFPSDLQACKKVSTLPIDKKKKQNLEDRAAGRHCKISCVVKHKNTAKKAQKIAMRSSKFLTRAPNVKAHASSRPHVKQRFLVMN